MSKLLIDEYPLVVLPSLAKSIGLHEAIILQQLHYWINHVGPDGKRYGRVADEVRWIRNTVKEWHQSNFMFLSESMIYRAFEKLEKLELIKSRKDLNKIGYDRTKWYTVDYSVLHQREMHFAPTRNRICTSEETIPETTTETTTDIKDTLTLWKELFPNKPQPRATNKSLQNKLRTRRKDAFFVENWELALQRASRISGLHKDAWFTLEYFLRNDDNWEKCLNNVFLFKDDNEPSKMDALSQRLYGSG